MNSTELPSSARLAGELFDQMLRPIATARRAKNEAELSTMRSREASKSYFSKPDTEKMEGLDFERSVYSSPEMLISAISDFWTSSGDTDLCSMIPMMKSIASALEQEDDEGDGSVNVFCYAMF